MLVNIKYLSWSQYYKERLQAAGGFSQYFGKKINEKRSILKVVQRFTQTPCKILEVGCGTGVISIHLSKVGYDAVGLDCDYDLVKNTCVELNREISGSAKFLVGNLLVPCFKEGTFDLVVSHGLLEHFEDDIIKLMISKMLRMGKIVVVSIPSKYFNNKTMIYGNERLLSATRWEKILCELNYNVVYKFGFSYNSILLNIVNIVLPKLTFYRAPHIGFVLITNSP